MKFICNVVGDLLLEDLNIKLSHLEVLEVTEDDLKTSLRLRESIRNGELIAYNPKIHKVVKNNKPKSYSKQETVRTPAAFGSYMKKVLDKLDAIVNKLDVLNKAPIPSEVKNIIYKEEKKHIIEKHNQKQEKTPIFVPELSNNLESNIVTENIESEGTDSILEKLKEVK